jgi:hypothetical protein
MKPEDLLKRIEALEAEIIALKNTTTIPREVDQAFRDRFGLVNYAILAGSLKSASSENQSVDEAGIATYSVLKPPDGFRQFVVGGTPLYFPYYL